MALRDQWMRWLAQRSVQPLPLRIVFWDGYECCLSEDPLVTLKFCSPKPLKRLLSGGDLDGLGAAYVEGDIEVEGCFQDLFRVAYGLLDSLGRCWNPRALLSFGSRHSKARDARAIHAHYDVSNEFYALWLDQHLIYSCAYFRDGSEDLQTAQEQKLEHLCRKLRLKAGELLLDIGCGWGGLLIWAAKRYGIRGVGVTLSPQQYTLARARVAAEGLSDCIEIRLQDYRDIPGAALYDKIVSVGMCEHVGLKQLPTYFGTIQRLLKEGGWVLNHGIATSERDDHKRATRTGFIDRYVFPNGELPHVWRVLHEMAGQSLETVDVENLRPHYAQTLIHWVRRLQAHQERAQALIGLRRYRIWSLYLAGCAYAFERGDLAIYQVLAVKQTEPGLAPRPWERRYQYDPDLPAPDAQVQWGEV
ncbi:MAG: class I SAM-dependent methyltransferase [Acidiferrobacteraceae bacterium]